MHDSKYYEDKFKRYPDVVTKKELTDMLGICGKTAQSLLQKEKIKHFHIRNRYQIPKVCVIDFLVGSDYNSYARNRAKAHHEISSDEIEKGQQKILLLCEQPRTRKELMYMLDVPSKKTFFRLYLKPLLEAGTIQMTIPNQRSVSTQRYVRVYKMKLDAMRRQAGRPSKENLSPPGMNFRGKQTLDVIAEEAGDIRPCLKNGDCIKCLIELI